MTARPCRGCGAPLVTTFVDLGSSPLSNLLVDFAACNVPEPRYPLHAFVCDRCYLVQLEAYANRETIFAADYPYYSSYSESWLKHAQAYAEMALARFTLGAHSRVVELASNDGYLLQYFVAAGIAALGIEPAEHVATTARARGVPTHTAFFGATLADQYRARNECADLVIANNVLAHVPDLHDFVAGVAALLTPEGWATFEFPHLLELIAHTEFDTIYHEHFSYFSLLSLEPIFARHGLAVVDVEALPTHGGSLRLFVRHSGRPVASSVPKMRQTEAAAGLDRIETYTAFPRAVDACRVSARAFFETAQRAGQSVVGYGAPAKGNTFLNFCGIGPDALRFTVDRNEHKVGKLLPGTHIPIRPVDALASAAPDYVFILPWNLREEITQQLAPIIASHTRLVTAIPRIRVLQ